MPGFIAYIGKEKFQFAPESRTKLVINRTEGVGYQVERRVVNKFMNDRLFEDTADYLIVVEGVVLNNHELMCQFKTDTWVDCVQAMYEQNGDTFFDAFRGTFSGILFDKKKNKWLIYTDQIGDKQVFVSETPDGFLFGSEMGFMVETRKQNDWPISIDETGCYMSLTFGFCIEDRTTVSEVRKLRAGNYFLLDKSGLREIEYHRFTNTHVKENMTVEEAVEGIDHYFRQAIKREYEKDLEYGYKHVGCLSGGLDSRMTVWVGHEMGYTDQLNITYCESGYLDFTIAQQIATDLHHEYLFKALDGGNFIPRYRFMPEMAYGMACCIGFGKSMECLLNYESLGLFHTGQLGDVIIGSYNQKLEVGQPIRITDGAYSQQLCERLEDYKFKYTYEDSEMFKMYNRGFCGINQGLLTYQENTEGISPFLDVDFFEFCFTIPLKLRFHHKIYFDWILQKYPKAADYIWEEIGRKITSFENREPRYMTVCGYKVPHYTDPGFKRYVQGFIKRRLGLAKKGQKSQTLQQTSKFNMNPVDYWYLHNPAIKEFFDSFWAENNHLIPEGQLKVDMTHLFKDCVIYDKMQCLSVLSAIKQIKS